MRNGPYEMVLVPEGYPGKRYRGRYCYEHHLVWWQNTGRLVRPGYLLHHKNENKRDNRFSNLEEITRAKHTSQHASERAPDLIQVSCGWCSKPMELKPHVYKERMKSKPHGLLFCSRSCGAKHQHSEVA